MFDARTVFGKFSNPSDSGHNFRERPPGLIQHVLTVLGRICFSKSSFFQKIALGNPWVGSSDSGKRPGGQVCARTVGEPLAGGKNRGRTVGEPGPTAAQRTVGAARRTVGEPRGLHREP